MRQEPRMRYLHAMNVPEDLRYSTDHEWVRVIDDCEVLVGITDYAQDALGDVVYVDLPATRAVVEAGEVFGEIESTKSVSELYAPVSGRILDSNDDLDIEPARVNSDPYGEGWMVQMDMSDPSELDDLLDAAAYAALIEG